MTPNRIRLFQWIAILCTLASAGFGSRCAAQSKTPGRSEGESLLLEAEQKLVVAESTSQRIRMALELPFVITGTPVAPGLLRSFSRVGLSSAIEQLGTPTIPGYSRGQFKAVVKEKLDGRDSLKVEWSTQRSVVVAPPREKGCMYCRPAPQAAARTIVVEDHFIVWLDATTKRPLKQVTTNGIPHP